MIPVSKRLLRDLLELTTLVEHGEWPVNEARRLRKELEKLCNIESERKDR